MPPAVFLAFVLFRERPGLEVTVGLVLGTIGVVLMAMKSGWPPVL